MYEPKPYGQNPQAAPSTAPPPPAYGYRPEPWPPSAPPPTMGVPVRAPFPTQQGRWTTGLCGCCEDCGNCWMTCCCPCITFGRIAEIVDRGSTSCGASGALYFLLTWLTCCHWIYSCSYRSKLRGQYNLWSRPCNDCLVHFCCECCALCQEYRELKNRGFDMQIGWYANANKQANGMTTPPVVPGGMMR